ncbi:TPA: MetQ/NlpA family ABC transporter substrate-binding protein, partial [Streptococcus pyogenes]
MSFKKWIGIVGIALASTVLVACSEKQDDKNTLTIGVMTKTESDQARWDKV